MFNDAMKAVGRVTVQLEEPTGDSKVRGRVIKSETHENTITDPFLANILARQMFTTPIGTAMRGVTKTASTPPGQYAAIHNSGTWGIYALNSQSPVTKATKIPPYINTQESVASNVTFYNVNASTTETNMEMVPVDARSGFEFVEGDNTHTLEYIKNTGTGIVRTVMLGRAHNAPDSTCGVLFGEFAHQAKWIDGYPGTCVQTMLDRTRLIKGGPTAPKLLDLLTKDILEGTVARDAIPTLLDTSYWSTLLPSSNGGTTGAAGSVLVNGHPYRVDYVSNVAGTSVTIRISGWSHAAAAPAGNYKDIIIPIEAGTTAMTYHPITVFNPVTENLECFVSVSYGMFPGTPNKYGINVKKVVFSDFPPSANMAAIPNFVNITETVTDLGIWEYGPAAPAQYQGLGFFDHLVNRYYLPCYVKANPTTGALITRGTTNFCPGYIFDNNWEIVGEWIARSAGTGNVGGSIVPMRTDRGLAYGLYDLATPYYPNITQVISGVVLAENYEKTSDNVLRLIYSYTLL